MNADGGRRLLRRTRLVVGAARRSLCEAPRWRLFLAVSGWGAMLGMLLLPPGSGLRVALIFGFVLTCPGLAVCLLLPVRCTVERWVAAVALSMSLAILLNVVLTMISNGSVPLRLGALALITTSAVIAAAVRDAADQAIPSGASSGEARQ